MKKKELKELLRQGVSAFSYFVNHPFFKPEVLQISLTHRCNLSCQICSVHKYLTTPEEEMDFEEIKKIIDIAKRQLNIKQLVITGGEPLLLGKSIVKITKEASRNNMSVILTTNGILLERYAQDLAEAGMSHFHVSIDGLRETHNFIRKSKTSFDDAVGAIKVLRDIRATGKYSYSIGIGAVILRENIKELGKLFLLGDSLGVDVLDMLPYLPDNTDFSSTERTSLWPSHKDVIKLKEIYKKIVQIKTKRIQLSDNIDINLITKYYERKLSPRDWRCFA